MLGHEILDERLSCGGEGGVRGAAFVDVADDADWTAIADGVIGNGHLERTEPAAEGDVLFGRDVLIAEQ